jgi:hypothetical protein
MMIIICIMMIMMIMINIMVMIMTTITIIDSLQALLLNQPHLLITPGGRHELAYMMMMMIIMRILIIMINMIMMFIMMIITIIDSSQSLLLNQPHLLITSGHCGDTCSPTDTCYVMLCYGAPSTHPTVTGAHSKLSDRHPDAIYCSGGAIAPQPV